MEDIKVLAFDTGGTVLDWHAGLTAAFAAWGAAQGIERDWHALANEHRRRSLHRMINTVDPGFNIGDVHRDVLGELFDENGLGGSAEERQAIAERWHQLDAQTARQALAQMIAAAQYIERSTEFQTASSEKLSTAIKVTTQVTEQLASGATAAAKTSEQLEQVVSQLRHVVGK